MERKTNSVSMLARLAQVERDRAFVLDASIEGASDDALRSTLQRCRAEHADDLDDLETALLAEQAQIPAESPRGLRAEARVAVAAIGGDEDIRQAVVNIEREALAAYAEAAADRSLDEPLRRRLASKLDKERRHVEWLRQWS